MRNLPVPLADPFPSTLEGQSCSPEIPQIIQVVVPPKNLGKSHLSGVRHWANSAGSGYPWNILRGKESTSQEKIPALAKKDAEMKSLVCPGESLPQEFYEPLAGR